MAEGGASSPEVARKRRRGLPVVGDEDEDAVGAASGSTLILFPDDDGLSVDGPSLVDVMARESPQLDDEEMEDAGAAGADGFETTGDAAGADGFETTGGAAAGAAAAVEEDDGAEGEVEPVAAVDFGAGERAGDDGMWTEEAVLASVPMEMWQSRTASHFLITFNRVVDYWDQDEFAARNDGFFPRKEASVCPELFKRRLFPLFTAGCLRYHVDGVGRARGTGEDPVRVTFAAESHEVHVALSFKASVKVSALYMGIVHWAFCCGWRGPVHMAYQFCRSRTGKRVNGGWIPHAYLTLPSVRKVIDWHPMIRGYCVEEVPRKRVTAEQRGLLAGVRSGPFSDAFLQRHSKFACGPGSAMCRRLAGVGREKELACEPFRLSEFSESQQLFVSWFDENLGRVRAANSPGGLPYFAAAYVHGAPQVGKSVMVEYMQWACPGHVYVAPLRGTSSDFDLACMVGFCDGQHWVVVVDDIQRGVQAACDAADVEELASVAPSATAMNLLCSLWDGRVSVVWGSNGVHMADLSRVLVVVVSNCRPGVLSLPLRRRVLGARTSVFEFV